MTKIPNTDLDSADGYPFTWREAELTRNPYATPDDLAKWLAVIRKSGVCQSGEERAYLDNTVRPRLLQFREAWMSSVTHETWILGALGEVMQSPSGWIWTWALYAYAILRPDRFEVSINGEEITFIANGSRVRLDHSSQSGTTTYLPAGTGSKAPAAGLRFSGPEVSA